MRKKAKTTKQDRAVSTRNRILKTTSSLLAKEGIHALRYSHIARLAKVPQALMGYHFPSQEALLLELVQRELEKLKHRSVENVEQFASQPQKALAAYIRAPFELAAEDAEFRSVWTAFYHLATVSEVFSDLNFSIRKMGRERILNLITMVMATEGRFSDKKAVTHQELLSLASSIQGIITGLAIMAASETKGDYKKFAALAETSAMSLLKPGPPVS